MMHRGKQGDQKKKMEDRFPSKGQGTSMETWGGGGRGRVLEP